MISQALVIDDSKTMRMILGRMLADLGFEVVEAADGREALGQLRRLVNPVLATVDWNMPVMDGYEFVKSVRAQPDYRDLTLMMVTTEIDVDKVVRALAAGANEYVMKPFTKDVILGKLELLGLIAAVS
jgi:two-component system, chemotaxis family, chemotaxis protein CheY